MAQPELTVVDPWHWLTEEGELPTEGSLRMRTLRVAQCIEAGGPLAKGHARETLIACRRRPEGTACLGLLWVVKLADDSIYSFCNVCDADEFVIRNWRDTDWAEGPMEPVDFDEFAGPGKRERVAAGVAAASDGGSESDRSDGDQSDGDAALGQALRRLGSALSSARVRALIASGLEPGGLLQAVVEACTRPPTKATLDAFVPVLIEAWNTTPRAELGGRSPDAVHSERVPARAGEKIGRNAPCPCGSGKKYKRCCGVGR